MGNTTTTALVLVFVVLPLIGLFAYCVYKGGDVFNHGIQAVQENPDMVANMAKMARGGSGYGRLNVCA